MTAKKWLVIIASTLSLISLIVAFIIGKSSNSIFYDISMAIFGSALLGAIMSLTEYFVERRKAMELFWDEGRKVVHELRKIRYIDIDAPHNLIMACFLEEESNKMRENFHFSGCIKSETAKENLISWIKNSGSISFTDVDDVNVYLNRIYAEKLELYRREYQRAIDSYTIAANIDIGLLGNAYGGLDFFFNKNIRNKAFYTIYDKICQFRNELYRQSYHFKLLEEGQGKFSVCADKAYNIYHLAFAESHKLIDGQHGKTIHQELVYDLDNSLEWFRCKIYRNEKYRRTPRAEIMHVTQMLSTDGHQR